MTLTVEGVSLIATVIPIALLVIGFEINRTPEILAVAREGSRALLVLGILHMAALLLGLLAESVCVISVATGAPLKAWEVVVVAIACQLLLMSAGVLLFLSLANRIGYLDWIARKATTRRQASPRRKARADSYLDEHHPNWREGKQ